MKRKKNKLEVSAILTSDWHLREDTPTCREDDWEKAQWNMVKQVKKLQAKYDCPVLHAGDLFHHWKPSPRLLSKCTKYLPDEFFTIYGNHDLPQHSMDLAEKCGVYNLLINHVVLRPSVNQQTDLGFDNANLFIEDRDILLAHVFVYDGSAPFPGAEKEATGHWLLDKYSDFDLILTGDNHQPFVCRDEERLLVNPGSLTRQTAKQISYKPRVYLYNSTKNKVKPYYLDCPAGEEVISRQHIQQKEERDERISAFVERLGTEWEADLDFRKNIERFEKENEIEEEVMKITYKALDSGG